MSTGSTPSCDFKRKRNFTEEEKNFLVELVQQHQDVITSKDNKSSMKVLKDKVWNEIFQKFNEKSGDTSGSSRNGNGSSNGLSSSSHTSRTLDQLKKCWENLRTKAKREYKQLNVVQTPEENRLQNKIISIIGDELDLPANGIPMLSSAAKSSIVRPGSANPVELIDAIALNGDVGEFGLIELNGGGNVSVKSVNITGLTGTDRPVAATALTKQQLKQLMIGRLMVTRKHTSSNSDTRNDSTGNDSEEEVKAEADNRLNREMVDDCSLDSEAKKEVEAELERDVDDEDDDDEVIDEEEDDRLEQDQLHKSVVKTNRDAPTTRLTRSHGRPKRVQAHVPARFEAQVLVPVEDDDENDDAFTETVQYFKDKVRRYPGTSFSNHKTRMETDDDDDDDDEGDKDDEMEDDVDDDEDEDDEEEIDEEEDEPKTNGLIDLDDGDEDDDDVEADDEIGDEMEEEPLGRPINQYQAQSRSSKRIAKSATSSRSLIQNRTRLVKSKRLQRSAGSNGGRKMNGMNEVNTSMNGNSQRRALSAANGMNGNGLTNGSKVTSLGSNSNIKGKSSGSCSDKSAKGNAFQDVLQELKVKEQKTRLRMARVELATSRRKADFELELIWTQLENERRRRQLLERQLENEQILHRLYRKKIDKL